MKNNNNIPSYHKVLKMSPETAILTSICKSFVLEDEELYNNEKTQDNKHNPDFWVEIGQRVSMVVDGYLTTESMKNRTEKIALIDFVMNQRFRGELIDLIIPAVESYLNDDSEYYD